MMRSASDQAPRLRLLVVGKTLFARLGYEQTSTAAIAREAKTSESQLMRYFEGKRGLLAGIFEASWAELSGQIDGALKGVDDAPTALELTFSAVLDAFERDPELAYLFLLEGRRVRSQDEDLRLSHGYWRFVELVTTLIRRGQSAGAITRNIDAAVLCPALVGAAEAMIRERVLAKRASRRPPFSREQLRRAFAILVGGARERETERPRGAGHRKTR